VVRKVIEFKVLFDSLTNLPLNSEKKFLNIFITKKNNIFSEV